VRSSDFSGRVVRSGESIEPKRSNRKSRARPAVATAASVPAERPLVAAVVGGSGSRGKRTMTDA
jgi:hypothetical protein